MSESVQNFKNHARLDPPYHFVLAPLTLGMTVWSWVHHFRSETLDSFFIAAGFTLLLIAVFMIRSYALKVQDRLIRLEERLRLQSLGSAALVARLPELTKGQWTALRFASDGEVAALAAKALDEKLSGKQIKPLIQNWQADYWRV